MTKNNYYQFKIDSFKIRIPLDIVPRSFVIKSFGDKHITISNTTGEVLKETTQNKYTYSIESDTNISSMTFELEKMPLGKTYGSIEVLTVMVTSKHLGDLYYGGINLESFKAIHKYMVSAGLNVAYDKLIRYGEYLDLDVCYDAILENYESIRDAIKSKAKASIKYGSGFHEFTKKDENQGFHFGTRANASISKPYIKVYNKTLDTQSNKHQYFFNYYGLATAENVYRTEFTIKNKRQIVRAYGLNNRISDLLEVTQDKWQSILKEIMSKHIAVDKQIRISQGDARKNISTQEVWIELLLLNKPVEIMISDIEFMLESYIDSRTTLNRQKELLRIVNNRILETNQVYKDTSEVSKYLNFFLK